MNTVTMINRQDYPELNFILWDMTDLLVSPQDAFYFYEKRWQYVDQNKLTAAEQQLIDTLIKTLGKNLFLTA